MSARRFTIVGVRAPSGSRAKRSRTALVLVDVINHMDFTDGSLLAREAEPIAPSLLRLRSAAHRAGCPVIYANDNFGDWCATSREIVTFCQRGRNGGAFTRRVRPLKNDLFVLKARNSAFYCTSLEPLLEAFGVRTLVLGGLTADNCVLFTAHDAYLRGLRLVVPEDGVAAVHREATERALQQMRAVLKARTPPAASVEFRA